MALQPKTAVVQIRLNQDLLARFQAACDAAEITLSEAIRQCMRDKAERYEKYVQNRQGRSIEPLNPPIPSPDTFELEKSPVPRSMASGVGKSRSERRADEREAKRDKKAGL